uniref:Uncharacterized protein n=1 Tax=Rhizophora mucronata TaxID=61149 RepID=A0A2P2NFZ0_RHIMU
MISSSVGWNRKPGGKSMRSSPLFTSEDPSIDINHTPESQILYIKNQLYIYAHIQ